jgi:hypothetical protein
MPACNLGWPSHRARPLQRERDFMNEIPPRQRISCGNFSWLWLRVSTWQFFASAHQKPPVNLFAGNCSHYKKSTWQFVAVIHDTPTGICFVAGGKWPRVVLLLGFESERCMQIWTHNIYRKPSCSSPWFLSLNTHRNLPARSVFAWWKQFDSYLILNHFKIVGGY